MYCPSSDKDTILFPFIVHDGGVTDVTGAVMMSYNIYTSMHSVHELGLPVRHCTISACCSVTVSILLYSLLC